MSEAVLPACVVATQARATCDMPEVRESVLGCEAAMTNDNRPGEKLQGASYAHRFTLYFGDGWSKEADKVKYSFRAMGHYNKSHFDVECVEHWPALPHMSRDGMTHLLTWLEHEIAPLAGADVWLLTRDKLLEVEKVA